jgi:hypothetical protein
MSTAITSSACNGCGLVHAGTGCRFAEEGVARLGQVRKGRGPKPSMTPEQVEQIVHDALHAKPKGETHWSAWSMARHSLFCTASGTLTVVDSLSDSSNRSRGSSSKQPEQVQVGDVLNDDRRRDVRDVFVGADFCFLHR